MNDETISQSSTPAPTPKRIKFKPTLLKGAKIKQFALFIAQSNPAPTRAKMFTRVHDDFVEACETALKEFIRNRVHRHPSCGKTLK